MKRIILHLGAWLLLVALLWSCAPAEREVVLLFTNDTHSQIEPLAADAKRNADMGGVERRKVLIDSLRGVYEDALLVDAGDAVQGTPYFNLYAGEVETMVMNELGYVVRTPGNHEFDNGCELLARQLAAFNGVTISSNYELLNDSLAPYIQPSWMCEAGGVKVGFVGVNVNPEGLFFPRYASEVIWHDPIARADSVAKSLREAGADVVVALSHLGYEGEEGDVIDSMLVVNSRYIDLVIGGHSHTTLREPAQYPNRDGRLVAVGQTGKSGAYLGMVRLTVPTAGHEPKLAEYSLLPVDARYDDRLDEAFAARLAPYRACVDSAMSAELGHSEVALTVDRPESPLGNWACDAFVEIAQERSGRAIDFALFNIGGIRADIMSGSVTRGDIWAAFPFTNYMTIVELKGSDVRDLFDQMAANGGEGVSREVRLVMEHNKVVSLSIGGKPVDDNRTYRIATINFVAEGGDGMVAMRNAVKKEDYPGFVYELFENYITSLQKSGKSMTATLDGRAIIKK